MEEGPSTSKAFESVKPGDTGTLELALLSGVGEAGPGNILFKLKQVVKKSLETSRGTKVPTVNKDDTEAEGDGVEIQTAEG